MNLNFISKLSVWKIVIKYSRNSVPNHRISLHGSKFYSTRRYKAKPHSSHQYWGCPYPILFQLHSTFPYPTLSALLSFPTLAVFWLTLRHLSFKNLTLRIVDWNLAFICSPWVPQTFRHAWRLTRTEEKTRQTSGSSAFKRHSEPQVPVHSRDTANLWFQCIQDLTDHEQHEAFHRRHWSSREVCQTRHRDSSPRHQSFPTRWRWLERFLETQNRTVS